MFTQTSLALPREVWLVYIMSMLAELAYLAAISRGYNSGDLSQVYPLARGSPPLLIALWSAIFLGERLPPTGYAGIIFLIVGIYLVSLPSPRDIFRPLRALSHHPAQLALLAAVCVSIYSTLDKIGVTYTSPLVYNFWVYAGIAVGYAPMVWAPRNRPSTIREWQTNRLRILLGSVATVSSYLLALIGMSMTSAAYVSAVRATSVVMGAAFGWLLLKERFGGVRVLAAGLMVAGLTMLAVAG